MNVNDTILVMIDLQTKLMPSINHNESIAKAAEILLKGCKILDVPVFVSQQYTKGLGPTIESLELHLESASMFEKISFSCTRDEAFYKAVKETGRNNVIIAGVESHICVQQTVLGLLNEGYNVFLTADATGSRKEIDHHYALKRMSKNGAEITTVESVLFELLVYADHPLRKEITKLVI